MCPAIEDDPFESIVSGLSLSVDESDVVNVQQMSDHELISMREEITDCISKNRSLFRNNTEWEREQHSLRAAIIIELNRRGIP